MSTSCLCKNVSPKEMEQMQQALPDQQTVEQMSEFFRVFGDGTRLKILHFLSRHELCVADLGALTGMQQSTVSHQLKILRLSRLVKVRKVGTTSYYSLDDAHVQSIFDIALEHIREVGR